MMSAYLYYYSSVSPLDPLKKNFDKMLLYYFYYYNYSVKQN